MIRDIWSLAYRDGTQFRDNMNLQKIPYIVSCGEISTIAWACAWVTGNYKCQYDTM